MLISFQKALKGLDSIGSKSIVTQIKFHYLLISNSWNENPQRVRQITPQPCCKDIWQINSLQVYSRLQNIFCNPLARFCSIRVLTQFYTHKLLKRHHFELIFQSLASIVKPLKFRINYKLNHKLLCFWKHIYYKLIVINWFCAILVIIW